MNNDHKLLDALLNAKQLKNDAALAKFLELTPSVLSKVRKCHVEVSDGLRILVMRKFGWPLALVDELAPPVAKPGSAPAE